MSDFTLNRGEIRDVDVTFLDDEGGAANLSGLTATMVIDGDGTHMEKTASVAGNVGTFAFVAADYASLRPTTRDGRRIKKAYRYAIWVTGTGFADPQRVGTFEVEDVPRLAP